MQCMHGYKSSFNLRTLTTDSGRDLPFNPINTKLFWGLPGPMGGGGGHIPPPEFLFFWLIETMKFGTDVKQVMI